MRRGEFNDTGIPIFLSNYYVRYFYAFSSNTVWLIVVFGFFPVFLRTLYYDLSTFQAMTKFQSTFSRGSRCDRQTQKIHKPQLVESFLY